MAVPASKEVTSPRVFLHLTKTAGGTLKAALSEAPSLAVGFLYSSDDRRQLIESGMKGLDLIYGHTLFGVDDELGLHPETKYMCFMRHPVTRTISHYYHLRNVEKGPVGEKIRQSRNINHFFAEYHHWEFSNFMSKVISGLGRQSPTEGISTLQMAVENIEARFEFIGFQEHFLLSMRALSARLGVPLSLKTEVNRGRYDLSDISEATIEKIERLNRVDMKLYKYCLKRFL